MTPTITVRHDMQSVMFFYRDLAEQYPQAVARTLNRTATTARAEAARLINGVYNIRIGAAKDQMRIERATRRDLRARVRVSGRPIPLIDFSARQTGKGVSVKVKNARKVVSHAFIATMPRTGHTGVFVRKGKGRLPIRQLFSLSLPAAFTQKEIIEAVIKVATSRFGEVLGQEMNYIQIRNATR